MRGVTKTTTKTRPDTLAARKRWLGYTYREPVRDTRSALAYPHVIGIDPGGSGALTHLEPDGAARVYGLPPVANPTGTRDLLREVIGRTRIDGRYPRERIHVFIESPTGVQAKKNTFGADNLKLGVSMGIVYGLLAAFDIGWTSVMARVWMGELKVGAKGTRSDTDWKRHLWAHALTLYPEFGSELAVYAADSVLIAEYGRRVIYGRMGLPGGRKSGC
jgi:hypothetical protein